MISFVSKRNLIKNLMFKAIKLRRETLLMFEKKGEAHLGGSFSMIEIIITLYKRILKKNDKFILSKAHASFPLCMLLKESKLNPKITTHLELDEKNGINCTTGSLGHGLPIATGMAFANKIQKKSGKIYVMISDGECQEGTTWESLLIASKHKLDNLIILIDYNKIQALSKLDDALPLNNLVKKFEAFNINCIDVQYGHNFSSILNAFNKKIKKNKPTAIIFNTIKGKGISFMEDNNNWHYRIPSDEEVKLAKKELKI